MRWLFHFTQQLMESFLINLIDPYITVCKTGWVTCSDIHTCSDDSVVQLEYPHTGLKNWLILRLICRFFHKPNFPLDLDFAFWMSYRNIWIRIQVHWDRFLKAKDLQARINFCRKCTCTFVVMVYTFCKITWWWKQSCEK